jgi:membrane associated rhomboid family serine protease
MWPHALRDLPPTRSGDARRALVTAVIYVLLFALLDVVWPNGDHIVATALLSGILFGLFLFAWLRWSHRGKSDAPQGSHHT